MIQLGTAPFCKKIKCFPLQEQYYSLWGPSVKSVSGVPWRIPLRTALVRGTFDPEGGDEDEFAV